MSIYRALNPLPSNMFIEPGQGGHIKRLENSFKNAKFKQDDLLVMYDNEFVTDVIKNGNYNFKVQGGQFSPIPRTK